MINVTLIIHVNLLYFKTLCETMNSTLVKTEGQKESQWLEEQLGSASNGKTKMHSSLLT